MIIMIARVLPRSFQFIGCNRRSHKEREEIEEIKAQPKILQANTSDFRYLTGQGKEMKIYMMDREKEGPWRRRNAFPCFIIKTSIDIVTLSIW